MILCILHVKSLTLYGTFLASINSLFLHVRITSEGVRAYCCIKLFGQAIQICSPSFSRTSSLDWGSQKFVISYIVFFNFRFGFMYNGWFGVFGKVLTFHTQSVIM